MAPMMVMTSDTTAAKIGRSMKKRLILMRLAVLAGGAWAPASFLRLHDRLGSQRVGQGRRLVLGCNLAARARALQAAHDHPVLGRYAFAHHAHALVEGTQLDVAPLD